MKNGLYVGQPHRKRLQDLHELSGQLLNASRRLNKSQRCLPDTTATLTRLQEIKSRAPVLCTTLLCSNSIDTSLDDPEPIARRYTDPAKAVSVLRRKDSPEYVVTINSAAYQEYATTTCGTSVTPSRPRSENKSRPALRTSYNKASRGLLLTSKSLSTRHKHYMSPLARSQPFRTRKYLVKNSVQAPTPRTCVFDVQDVLDARRATIVHI